MGFVYVLVPAHNEQDTIGATLTSLRSQSTAVDGVVVVADNCTDATASVARRHGATVLETVDNTDMKAGALNQGLDLVLRFCGDDDHILIMDADSRLAPEFVSTALSTLASDSSVGAVCALFAGEPDRGGLIHALQRAEYTRFARMTTRKSSRAQVLSGVATVFPVPVLHEVAHARQTGRLPAAPGIYDVVAATEDIEMTYAVQALGYRPLAPAACLAWTDTMSSWTALATQRIRWQRGMLDALRIYGMNRLTLPSACRLLAMYLGSLIAPFYLALMLVGLGLGYDFSYRSVWLAVIPLFCFERWWTVRHLGRTEKLLAVTLLPEWLYDNFRAAVYWTALFRWVRRTERVWVPT